MCLGFIERKKNRRRDPPTLPPASTSSIDAAPSPTLASTSSTNVNGPHLDESHQCFLCCWLELMLSYQIVDSMIWLGIRDMITIRDAKEVADHPIHVNHTVGHIPIQCEIAMCKFSGSKCISICTILCTVLLTGQLQG
ncbi:hypothetical protein QJS04_geneDACA018401 [Acorus gramineus]|uniref:Uncharacterized protein n=1 Tax=Acorus gramineus TaxID=55184 RepID=A0AAV9ADD9_ACOGR|nr:hypothetical protein QJS04_geneDACA018401 [Acorus gramineus]